MDKAVHPVNQVMLYLCVQLIVQKTGRGSGCICTWSGAESNMEAAQFCSLGL